MGHLLQPIKFTSKKNQSRWLGAGLGARQLDSSIPSNLHYSKLAIMQQAPPPVANSGEDAITRVLDVEPSLFATSEVPLVVAYEVESTLAEIEKGGYIRVSGWHLRVLEYGADSATLWSFLDCASISG